MIFFFFRCSSYTSGVENKFRCLYCLKYLQWIFLRRKFKKNLIRLQKFTASSNFMYRIYRNMDNKSVWKCIHSVSILCFSLQRPVPYTLTLCTFSLGITSTSMPSITIHPPRGSLIFFFFPPLSAPWIHSNDNRLSSSWYHKDSSNSIYFKWISLPLPNLFLPPSRRARKIFAAFSPSISVKLVSNESPLWMWFNKVTICNSLKPTSSWPFHLI